jgi:hypothetical protein
MKSLMNWRTNMPDLRTELMKLSNLSFDDPGEPDVPTNTETKPMSERQVIWNYIKANPMSSCAGVSAALGIDVASSASQMGALLNRSLVTREHVNGSYHYRTVGDSYPFFDRVAHGKKIGTALRSNYKKKNKVKAEREQEQAKLQERAARAQVPISLASFSAQDMLESMPVGKARALYVELKKLFEA